MEKVYMKNAILPDADNFVYDIQKEFDFNYDNSWDDDEEV